MLSNQLSDTHFTDKPRFLHMMNFASAWIQMISRSFKLLDLFITYFCTSNTFRDWVGDVNLTPSSRRFGIPRATPTRWSQSTRQKRSMWFIDFNASSNLSPWWVNFTMTKTRRLSQSAMWYKGISCWDVFPVIVLGSDCSLVFYERIKGQRHFLGFFFSHVMV